MKVMLRKTVDGRASGAGGGWRLGLLVQQVRGQEEAIKTQWAEVENQLQRRNDLIPNLVETVKGIAQQERDVFGQIAESRAKLAGAKTPEQTIEAANEQSAALARLLVDRGELPAAAVERVVQPSDGRALGHGEPHRGRADAIQRAGPGVQHVTAAVPVEHHGGHLRLQGHYPLFNAPPGSGARAEGRTSAGRRQEH